MDLICGVGGLACEFEAQGGELLGVHKKFGLEGHILSPAKQDRLVGGAGLKCQLVQVKDPVENVGGPAFEPSVGFGSFPVSSGDFRLSHGVSFGGSRDERVFGRLK